MKSSIDNCCILAIKRRREVGCGGIELENGEEVGQIGEGGYKYLGILEKRDICQENMKKKEKNIRKVYFKRLRAISKSKLNAKHVFQVIST